MGEIKSRFDSIVIWIATKIRLKHCAIRFKYHAIWYWFDSNFNDSIQETRDLNRNLEIMVEIEYSFSLLTTHYSVRSYLQIFGFYPSLMYARNNNSLSVIIRRRPGTLYITGQETPSITAPAPSLRWLPVWRVDRGAMRRRISDTNACTTAHHWLRCNKCRNLRQLVLLRSFKSVSNKY